MANLERRSGRRISRRDREARAYRLTLATGGFTLATVVLFVLAIVGPLSMGLPILTAIIAVICFVLLRRSLGM